MLFDIIRDFFVLHVWGGRLANGTAVNTWIGNGVAKDGTSVFGVNCNSIAVPIKAWSINNSKEIAYITIGDWLSTTSTIITMVVILVCIAFFIRWIFKVCSNAILLR